MTPEKLGHSRNPRPREPLSRERIVEQAIALVESEGEEALTMRRLGSALGVQAMSLYHHVGSRDELTEAIAARLFEPAHDLDLGTDWRDAADRFAHTLRQMAIGHPRAFRLVGLRPLDAPRAAAQRLLSVFEDAGLERANAFALYRALASFARGYALGESAGFTVGLGEIGADEAFERGLGALLDGFASAPV